MMSNTMGDDNWGERRLAQRNRQRWLFKGAMIAAALAFLVVTQFVLQPASRSDAAHVAAVAVFMLVVGVLGAFAWRRIDEIQRRVAVNAFAVMGFVSVMLMPIAGIAGPLIKPVDPMLLVYVVAILTIPVAVVVQRIRG